MRSAEDSLSKSPESFFKSLLETAPDAMIIVDNRGRIVIVNCQAALCIADCTLVVGSTTHRILSMFCIIAP